MKTSPSGYRRSLLPALLLCLLALLASARAESAAVRLPPVPEAPELGWVRRPFFEALPPWDLDPVLFPAALRATPAKPSGPAETAWALLREADEKGKSARNNESASRPLDDAARLYLRAYAADKNGAIGFLGLRMAARSYFQGGRYAEAAGVATTLIRRSGGRGADLPYYLFKGEALYQKRDLLAARECFRRAQAGKFDPYTRMRIDLRIADASLELGNTAYAEPAYRKTLRDPAVQRKQPWPSIRYGESLLGAGRFEEAATLFRNLDTDQVPPPVRAAALLGAGDAALLGGNLPGAGLSYRRAAGIGDFPETRDWVRLRLADLAFAGGNRAEALKGYSALSSASGRSVAREAGYKKAVALYLLGDNAAVVKASEDWLAGNAGRAGDKEMRALAAKAGADFVRAAAKTNPSGGWPALSAMLFAIGRTKELPALLADIGKEWEDARIWGGAADLYNAAGDAGRSADMKRIAAAEAAYWRGDLPGVLRELDWRDPSREHVAGALWLAAKTLFRQGRYAEADAALRRLESVRADTPVVSDGTPFPPARELSAFSRALPGRWAGMGDEFRSAPSQGPVPGLSMLKAMAEPKKEKPPAGKRPAKPARSTSGGDLYADYQRIRERVGRINAEEGATP